MWEAQFNLIYNSNGGITLNQVQKMSKKKFLWMLKRLAKQKKDENDAINKANKVSTSSTPSKGMRYLGKL